jgi:hypothetical protein
MKIFIRPKSIEDAAGKVSVMKEVQTSHTEKLVMSHMTDWDSVS